MKKLITISFTMLCLSAPAVMASGSGAMRPPKSGGSNKQDGGMKQTVRYATGQQVYEGKARGAGNADTQAARLAKVAAMVPDMKKAAMLRQMAGQISDEQLAALEYFVATRFPR
jgi:hypothetical protein